MLISGLPQSPHLNLAQELLRYQRSFEEAAQHAWRAKSGSGAAHASKATQAKSPSATRWRLLREDSAYEPLCGYREAIRKVLMTARATASVCLAMQLAALHPKIRKLCSERPRM